MNMLQLAPTTWCYAEDNSDSCYFIEQWKARNNFHTRLTAVRADGSEKVISQRTASHSSIVKEQKMILLILEIDRSN